MNDTLIGQPARVTATVSGSLCGEVMVSVRGGTETLLAYAADPNTEIAKGKQVVIVDEAPGRLVYVS